MKELIKLAKEKGFESRYVSDLILIELSDTNQYLWMCELQKWLFDKYEIMAYIDFFSFEYVFIEYERGIVRESIPHIIDDNIHQIKWLEGLLFEALKLL
jgi:5'(3')-deoxyribonucleotidase